MRRMRQLLPLVFLALGAVVVGAGLPGFRLGEGYRIAGEGPEVNLVAPPVQVSDDGGGRGLERVVQALIILSIVVTVFSLLARSQRRNTLILGAVTLVLAFGLSLIQPSDTPLPPQLFEEGAGVMGSNADMTALQEEERVFDEAAPDPSTELTVVFGALALLVLAGTGVLVVVLLRRRGRRTSPAVAESLRKAEESIGRGASFSEVIIQCFADMEWMVEERRGVPRKQTMTPREFEDLVVHEGGPPDAVRSLVRTFELVRYGGLEPDDEARNRARDDLRRIADAVEAA